VTDGRCARDRRRKTEDGERDRGRRTEDRGGELRSRRGIDDGKLTLSIHWDWLFTNLLRNATSLMKSW